MENSNSSLIKHSQTEPVRAIVRAFAIIESLVENDGNAKPIKEIAERTGLSKGTIHRIITTLVELGYVEKSQASLYSLGLKVTSLSAVILNHLEITNVAQVSLNELAKETNLTSHLGTFDNDSLLYLAKANSNLSIQTTSYIGQRSYLHSTSLGKAICAFSTEERVVKGLLTKGMPKFTENTITTIDEFLKEIKKVRDCGYAVDNEENEKYVRCIAAPIFDHNNKVTASISVSGSVIHIKEESISQLAKRVVATAEAISKKMGSSL
jgi:DNA-binding IclR family transcriptional regulator